MYFGETPYLPNGTLATGEPEPLMHIINRHIADMMQIFLAIMHNPVNWIMFAGVVYSSVRRPRIWLPAALVLASNVVNLALSLPWGTDRLFSVVWPTFDGAFFVYKLITAYAVYALFRVTQAYKRRGPAISTQVRAP